MATKEEWAVINDQVQKLMMMNDGDRIVLMKKIIGLAPDLRTQAIISIFYIYGARPEELLELTKADFSIRDEDIMVRLPTAKSAPNMKRWIVLNKDTVFMDIILRFLNTIPIVDWLVFKEFTHPTNFNKATAGLEKKYKEMYGEDICLSPYVFRKFRISWLLSMGAQASELLAWKGGKDLKAIENSYTFLKPVTAFKKGLR
jgi:integrase